jgi:hypothetical protein
MRLVEAAVVTMAVFVDVVLVLFSVATVLRHLRVDVSMKLFIMASVLFLGLASAEARTRVSGYSKRSGSYVGTHMRTSKDATRMNNWSTKGNINPYTGKKGYKN